LWCEIEVSIANRMARGGLEARRGAVVEIAAPIHRLASRAHHAPLLSSSWRLRIPARAKTPPIAFRGGIPVWQTAHYTVTSAWKISTSMNA
jgi:hypothetical protein